MKIVYDEWYGDLSFAQRAAYRKYNVSPADHDAILMHFRAREHDAITKYVKFNASNNKGMFSSFEMERDVLFGYV